jgi:hypothetical protein
LKSLAQQAQQLDVRAINETLNHTRRATDALGDVLRNLSEHPSGVLFGRPPPPAKSLKD